MTILARSVLDLRGRLHSLGLNTPKRMKTLRELIFLLRQRINDPNIGQSDIRDDFRAIMKEVDKDNNISPSWMFIWSEIIARLPSEWTPY